MVCDAGDKYKALWVVNAYLLFQEVSVWIVQDYRKYENSPKGKDNNKKARLFNKLNVYLSFSRHTPLHERMRTTFIHPTAKRFLIGQKKTQVTINSGPIGGAVEMFYLNRTDKPSAGPLSVFDNNDSVDNVHILTIGPPTLP